MALDFSPISFPWELVSQAQQMRNQNQQNFQQNLAGMGTGLGNIANAAAKYKAINIIQQAIANQRGQTGAPLAPGMQGPQMPTPDLSSQPGVLPAMMVLNPEAGSKALMSQFDPSLQSEIGLRLSESAKNRMETNGGLPATLAARAETERAHKAEEAQRSIDTQYKNFMMQQSLHERERAATQDEQLKADNAKQAIIKNNYFATHWSPWQSKAERDIEAIKGPMDPGYQPMGKYIGKDYYIRHGNEWFKQ